MATLYILGNGFDLAHGMNTSLCCFKHFLKYSNNKDHNDLYKRMVELYPLEGNWKNFEEALAYPKTEIAKQYEALDYQDFFINELNDAFTVWITEVNNHEKPHKIFSFKPNSKFLTFNYTSILEDPSLYGIDNSDVCHIHNYVVAKYFFSDKSHKLIFGHGEKQKQNSNTLSGVAYKNTLEIFEKNKYFFNGLTNIDEIVMIGFSYSLIDRLYFEKLNEMFPNANWILNVHNDEDIQNREIFVKNIGIKHYVKEEKQ